MAEGTQAGGENESGAERRWGTAESWVVGFGAGLVIVALMGAAYSIGYHRGQGSGGHGAQPVGQKPAAASPAAAAGPGKELFTQTCGACHTLADAGTTGTVGPNLDALEPDAARVEAAIRNGGAGSGMMPPDLYSGKQAEQVVAYVAAVAGK